LQPANSVKALKEHLELACNLLVIQQKQLWNILSFLNVLHVTVHYFALKTVVIMLAADNVDKYQQFVLIFVNIYHLLPSVL